VKNSDQELLEADGITKTFRSASTVRISYYCGIDDAGDLPNPDPPAPYKTFFDDL
jgi:hypothetical protein